MAANADRNWVAIGTRGRVLQAILSAVAVFLMPAPAHADPAAPRPMAAGAADAQGRAIHNSGASSSTPTALAAGITAACDLQAWQFSLRPVGDKGALKLAISPTLSGANVQCINAVIYASRFTLAP